MHLHGKVLKALTEMISVGLCFLGVSTIFASEATKYHKIPEIIQQKYSQNDAVVVSSREPSRGHHFPSMPDLPSYREGGPEQFILVSETNLTTKKEKYLLSQDVLGIPLGRADELYFENELPSSQQTQDQPEDKREQGDYFEGDISGVELISNPGASLDLLSNQNVKNAVQETYKKWPKGEIPYTISQRFSSYDRSVILKAMKEIAKVSCLKWRPRYSYDKDYVHIMSDSGCYSRVGKVGGPQVLSLGLGCVRLGTVIHEMLHAAGFWHEQSRPDRNDNVRIFWENIQNGFDDNFARYSRAEVTTLDLPYDTGSVMHYASTAFSKNGRATILPINPNKQLLGQRAGMSKLDIQKLNILYNCGDNPINPPSEIKCVDIYNNGWCYTWGRRGGCHRYKAFMKDYCPKTCNLCSEIQVTSTLIVQSKCEDNDVRCPAWAKYTDYKCPSNFLMSNCKKSCRVCTSPSFMDAQNHEYGAVIIDAGHGSYLGDGNGAKRMSNFYLYYTVIVNVMATYILSTTISLYYSF